MSHRTFAVKISSAPGGQLRVSVIGSPAGEASDVVDGMVDPGELELLRRSLTRTRHVGGVSPSGPAPVEDPGGTRRLLESIGHELFQSLIPDGIRPTWEESKGRAASDGANLRIEIHIDPREELLRPVASLPWELSFQQSTGAFLGLDPSNTVIRYLDLGRSARGVRFDQTIRVLVAESKPLGVPSLDLAEERDRLIALLNEAQGIEVDLLEQATPTRLRQRLVLDKPHVLHFMGHGFSDPSNGWGGLVLETEDGEADELGGHDLRDLFQGIPDLSLAVLNACDTARPGSSEQPFAGAAAGLAYAGIPAVVAMQFPISDRAAILFSKAFYEMLSAGRGIAEAMVEGRMAIHLDDRRSLEWITPVLFMRGGEQSVVAEGEETNLLSAESGPLGRPPKANPQVEQTVHIGGGVENQFTVASIRELNMGKSK